MKKIFFLGVIISAINLGCSHKMSANKSNQVTKAAVGNAGNNGMINLQKGQNYTVESKTTTSSSSEVQGQTMETNANVTTTYNLEVTDIAGENYKMNNKIASIKMNMTTMGQSVNFDSDNKDDMNGEIGSTVKGMINNPQTIVMDKSGNIITDSTKSADSSKAGDSMNPMAMMMKQMGDPAQQGYGAKMAFEHLPAGAKVGTAWQDSVSKDGNTTITHFIITAINADTATIKISGTDNRESKIEIQGMDIQTNTKGTISGEAKVNINTGVIFKNSTTMDAKGTISAMGQDIPTTIKAITTNTVTPEFLPAKVY